MIPASFLPPARLPYHDQPILPLLHERLLLYHFQSDSRLPPFCFFTLGRVTPAIVSLSSYPSLSNPTTPGLKLLISYVFEWTLLAPRNFETLIFNNSASAHGILIFRSFNGKRPRPFVPAFPSYSFTLRSHKPPLGPILTAPTTITASSPFLTLRLDIQSLRDVLSRFLGHELSRRN